MNSAVLIGYGSIGGYHAKLLDKRHAKLAIVDGNESARVDANKSYPKCHTASSLEELDTNEWDWANTLAVIATWGPSHSEIFHQLVGLGVRRVLCEKPLAHSVKAAADMVATAKSAGVALGSHLHREYSGFSDAMQNIQQKTGIGSPCSMIIHGGAAGLVTNGIHYLGMASRLFGRAPEWVVSTAREEAINPRSPSLRMYGGTATWSYGDGRELTMFMDTMSSIATRTQVFYRNAVIEVFPNLWIEVRRRLREELDRYPAVTRLGEPKDIVFDGKVPGIRPIEECTSRILDEIEQGNVLQFTPGDALQVVGSCIGALTAGFTGQKVHLPIEPDSDIGRAEWPIS